MNQDPNAKPVVNPPEPTVAAPAETPGETPVETPVEAPVTEPPVETPVETPAETPVIRRKRRAAANDKNVDEEAVVSTVLRIAGPDDYRLSRMTGT